MVQKIMERITHFYILIFIVKKSRYGVLTATMALLRGSHDVLSRPYGGLVGDSLRSHDAFAALSRRLHCTCGVLKMQ